MLIDAIREICKEEINWESSPKLLVGEIISKKPLKIQVEQVVLEEDDLILLECFKPFSLNSEVKIQGEKYPFTINVDRSGNVGDMLFLLQLKEGERYIVLSILDNGAEN